MLIYPTLIKVRILAVKTDLLLNIDDTQMYFVNTLCNSLILKILLISFYFIVTKFRDKKISRIEENRIFRGDLISRI